MYPLLPETIQHLNQLTAQQLAWLSGYCWAKANNQEISINSTETSTSNIHQADQAIHIQIISASQTGNARKVAEQLQHTLQNNNIHTSLIAAVDYKPKNLANETFLILVTSTQGEGEPPEEAISLHKYLFGKKAPNLEQLSYAVLGLGDSSYPQFCGAAKQFDEQLAKLGGKRLQEYGACDLDFQAAADEWIKKIVPTIQSLNPKTHIQTSNNNPSNSQTHQNTYTKDNPFIATLSARQKITGRGSEKNVQHLEIDLTDSNIQYTAGDALGVWFRNDIELVNTILSALSLSGNETVQINKETIDLQAALLDHLEITQNTPQFVQGYAKLANHQELNQAIADNLNHFVQNNPIASIVQQYPATISAEQLVQLLRPINPRLYSIASSQAEVGDEVHITVGLLNYTHQGKNYTGGASGFLTQRIQEDDSIRIFIEPNTNFRLPENPNTPIIMIGAGTGIAPFRAFMQQRVADEANGKNWLIFGNQRASEDFLYQIEWQQFVKDGYLHQYDFAWSRDYEQKIYVQDKIQEKASTIWQWIEQGAHIYVCGSANGMAKEVEAALLQVIVKHGNKNTDDAEEYLDEMRQNKRYQRDVY